MNASERIILEARIKTLQDENAGLKALLDAAGRIEAPNADKMDEMVAELMLLRSRLDACYQRTPPFISEAAKRRGDLSRMMILAGTSGDHPLWLAILSYADEHERNERAMALRPGLTDGDRQFEAGRAASASDFAGALRDLMATARTRAASMEKKKEG